MYRLALVTPRIVSVVGGATEAVLLGVAACHGQHPEDDRNEPVFREAEGKGQVDPKSFSRSIAPGQSVSCFCGTFLWRSDRQTLPFAGLFIDFVDSAIRGFSNSIEVIFLHVTITALFDRLILPRHRFALSTPLYLRADGQPSQDRSSSPLPHE